MQLDHVLEMRTHSLLFHPSKLSLAPCAWVPCMTHCVSLQHCHHKALGWGVCVGAGGGEVEIYFHLSEIFCFPPPTRKRTSKYPSLK